MSDSESEQVPQTQAAPSGGPPKPPKKTAKGLDDESPADPRLALADAIRERLLAEYTKSLETPGLSAARRAKIERTIREIKEEIKKPR
jgi:hypothetical protein